MKNIGVLLSGCGNKDGSEIYEATFTVLALSQNNVNITFIAPDRKQYDVVNYLDNEKLNESRNILLESARIARGNIVSLNELDIDSLDGLIIPGGFGVAKNYSDYVVNGIKGSLTSDISTLLSSIYEAEKPIGAICISPVLLMLKFKDTGLKLTTGLDSSWMKQGKDMGIEVHLKNSRDIVIDEKMKIVTTPAFMNDASFADVNEGISKLVMQVLDWC